MQEDIKAAPAEAKNAWVRFELKAVWQEPNDEEGA